jgi:hypothetical protein
VSIQRQQKPAASFFFFLEKRDISLRRRITKWRRAEKKKTSQHFLSNEKTAVSQKSHWKIGSLLFFVVFIFLKETKLRRATRKKESFKKTKDKQVELLCLPAGKNDCKVYAHMFF